MGLDTLTRAGSGQTEKNKKMRQSKCGEARDYMAYGSTRHNVEYAEVNPRNTSKMCFMCCGYNTLREDRKLTCHDCRKTIHADVNAAFNILYTYSIVWWSARIRSVQKLQREVRLASRGQIHLDTGIIPPVVGATPSRYAEGSLYPSGWWKHQQRVMCFRSLESGLITHKLYYENKTSWYAAGIMSLF